MVLLYLITAACSTILISADITNRNVDEGVKVIDHSQEIAVTRSIINHLFEIRVTCMQPYVIHPRYNYETAERGPLVYVEAGGNLEEVPLSRIITGINARVIVDYRKDEGMHKMTIRYCGVNVDDYKGAADLIRRHATHIYFICALPDTDILRVGQGKIGYLVNSANHHLMSVKEYITKHIKSHYAIMEMFSIDISGIKKVTHGCGSKDTPEFMNEVHHDVESGVRSCTVDIMEHPDVGFYCDGKLQPSGCFRFLFDSETYDEANIDGIVYLTQSTDDYWNFVTFERKRLKKKFSGYCQCVDEETGQVKAQINIMTGMSHVCDINGLMFKHLTQPIIGNWCDVALLPGSTLTIKVPVNIYNEETPILRDGKLIEPIPVMMNSYMFPLNMNDYFLNHKEVIGEFRNSHMYDRFKSILSDALCIDQSRQKDEGIITLRYVKDAPLTYPYGIKGLAYIWSLITNKDSFPFKNTIAVINFVPAITHEHYMIGCEPPTSSIFPIWNGKMYFYRNIHVRGYSMNVFHADNMYNSWFAFYCPPGHNMEPNDCEEVGYDETLQSLSDWNGVAKLTRNEMVHRMLLFQKLDPTSGSSYSRSCSCLDGDGVEKARVTVSNYNRNFITYDKLGAQRNMKMIVPVVTITHVCIEDKNLPEVHAIPFCTSPPPKTNILSPGVALRIGCYGDSTSSVFEFIKLHGRTEPFLVEGKHILDEALFSNKTDRQKWVYDELSVDSGRLLPLNMQKYFYQHVITSGKHKMVPVEYSQVLGTNITGLKIVSNANAKSKYDNGTVDITYPMSSILVSKSNATSVKLHYICGKLTRAHRRTTDEDIPDMYRNVEDDNKGSSKNPKNAITETSHEDSIPSGSDYPVIENDNSLATSEVKETRSLTVFGVINIAIHPTDPYLHGCGMTDPSEELFRDDTVPLLNNANEKIGCEVDIAEGDASFYCPLPYHTEPPNCMPTSSTVAFNVKQPGGKGNRHFYIFTKGGMDSSDDSMLHVTKREVFECHCVTNKGIRMATIRVHA
ncbi:hypothetical protein BgAZ_403650 [Babesia gibsoni]|uniref:6-Cys domain-containing protein n=1 Tax=Babesia gibsoni TaxID=33632 RepID=A0AAD8P887_BABGI|nr:hypothetical protein BgAZ_403650 [Babesia gibsoni]